MNSLQNLLSNVRHHIDVNFVLRIVCLCVCVLMVKEWLCVQVCRCERVGPLGFSASHLRKVTQGASQTNRVHTVWKSASGGLCKFVVNTAGDAVLI